jgi:hypothetical protein
VNARVIYEEDRAADALFQSVASTSMLYFILVIFIFHATHRLFIISGSMTEVMYYRTLADDLRLEI